LSKKEEVGSLDEVSGPTVKVYRIEGELRELLGSFRTKSEAVRFAREASEKDKLSGNVARYEINVVIPEFHLKVTHSRKIAPLGHEAIKVLTAAWIEATYGVSRTYNEKTIGGRKLDLVLENPSDKGKYRIFVEVETKPVEESYMRNFLRFCKKYRANNAFLVSPIVRSQEFHWTDKRLKYKPRLLVIPTRDIYDRVNELYTIKFEKLNGDIVIALEPNKEYVITGAEPKD
jgi:hypothetical protein